MFCSNCGQSMGDDVKFCPNCGASRSGEAQKNVQPIPSPVTPSPYHAAQLVTPSVSGMAIAGFICSFFIGIVGLILSIIALNQINQSNGQLSGRGMAIAGIWISAISMLVMFIVLSAS